MSELHTHCQCDQCDGTDCEFVDTLPRASKLTTQELVDELCKREGVMYFEIPLDEKLGWGYITVGNKQSVKVWGKVKILVVKE